MYKAVELYPKRDGAVREKIYLTQKAARNIQLFFERARRFQVTQEKLCSLLGVGLAAIWGFRKGYMTPKMDIYLKMMKTADIKLDTTDVNYAYANVSYPPEDIDWRLERIGISKLRKYSRRRNINILIEATGKIDRAVMYDTLSYGPRRSIECYGRVMFFIMAKEKAMKLPKRLHFAQ